LKDVGEIGEWFDVVEFCRGDQGRGKRPMFGASIISREQGILSFMHIYP